MITSYSPVVGSSAQTSTAPPNKSMGKDDFLKLLVAQMQAQDPLDPMESTDFSAQLAQFSALEQMQNVNKNLESLIEYQASNSNNMAINLIDKKVTVPGDDISIAGGNPDSLPYELGRDAAAVTVKIYDSLNNLVASIDRGPEAAGRHDFAWDGKDSSGKAIPDGSYTFEVSAVNGTGVAIATRTLNETLVTGILFENGTSYVVTEDEDIIDLRNITSINSAS